MKNIKMGLKLAGIIIGGMVTGFILMVAVYLLPTDRMKGHVADSSEIFNYEGIYPQIITGFKCSQLDNYTDSLMYATAIHPGNGNVVRDAMQNARYEYWDCNMVQALNDYANDVSDREDMRYEITYPRYWHGYLVILKPLLLFLDISEIRMFSMLWDGILIMLLLYLIRSRLKEWYQIPFFMMLMVINPLVLPLSLQFSWVWYIAIVGAIAVLTVKKSSSERQLFLFLVLGMATSFMDLLTYPLVTLGLPLVMLLLKEETKGVRKQIMLVIKLSVGWTGGYCVMWASKWIFAFTIGKIDLLSDVFSEIGVRLSMQGENQEILSGTMVLGKNAGVLMNREYVLMGLIFLICCIWILWKKKVAALEGIKVALPYVVIMVMPLVWFLVFSNHSWVHYWFTYRELAVSVLSGSAALIKVCCDGRRRKGL